MSFSLRRSTQKRIWRVPWVSLLTMRWHCWVVSMSAVRIKWHHMLYFYLTRTLLYLMPTHMAQSLVNRLCVYLLHGVCLLSLNNSVVPTGTHTRFEGIDMLNVKFWTLHILVHFMYVHVIPVCCVGFTYTLSFLCVYNHAGQEDTVGFSCIEQPRPSSRLLSTYFEKTVNCVVAMHGEDILIMQVV